MEVQLAAGSRMAEAEFTGMQRESLPRPVRVLGFFPAITRLTEHRVALLRKVDADLIASPCFQRHADLSRFGESLHYLVMSDRQFPLVGGRDGVAIEVFIGREEAAERARIELYFSRDECLVTSLWFAFGELLTQFLGNLQAEGNNQQPGDIAVEAVYRKEFRWLG